MKKFITVTMLTFGLLQGFSISYAEFLPKNFQGHYGGTFYGNVFSVDPVAETILQEVGIITFEHIGEADGFSKYAGEIIANTTVINLPPETEMDMFNCQYQVAPINGRVELTCSFETSPVVEITGNLQCVLIPHVYHKKGDLGCVGTLNIMINATTGPELFIANVTGKIINRD